MLFSRAGRITQDRSKAIHIYEMSAALGSSLAALQLGIFYYWGIGIAANVEKAKNYLLTSALFNNTDAQVLLARIIVDEQMEKIYAKQEQEEALIDQQFVKAAELCQKAASLGNVDAISDLGIYYCHGFEVEKNLEKAASCFRKAASKGVPEAKKNLTWLLDFRKEMQTESQARKAKENGSYEKKRKMQS